MCSTTRSSSTPREPLSRAARPRLSSHLRPRCSDNGFEANGERPPLANAETGLTSLFCAAGHRRQPGKTLPYEEDINIPLGERWAS